MRKPIVAALAAVIIVVIAVSVFAVMQTYTTAQPTPTPMPAEVAPKKPFYVGVTYCGNSTNEAKQLIDEVKNYTNLFVIQSGPLMSNWPAMEQICDYAVNNSLNLIVYYARNGDAKNTYKTFLDVAPERWGSNLLGVYYNDEPGGKMIDSSLVLYDNTTGGTINAGYGSVYQYINDESSGTGYNYMLQSWGDISITHSQTFPDHATISNETTYFPNGTVTLWTGNFSDTWSSSRKIWYQPNGTVHDENGTLVTDAGDISQFESYEEVYNQRPIQTHAEAANLFVGGEQNILSTVRNISDVRLFTSDYALDWFDYQAGYDVVLTQLGWGQSATQNIARIRGAATLQNKSWGAMVTWASLQAPYLMSGDQMFEEMRQSYRGGAEYVVVFNYNQSSNALDSNGTSSTPTFLSEEHFDAIERFWNEVVQNPAETNNAAGTVAFVLPQYYGWGMRNADDHIWGIFPADATSRAIWSNLQNALAEHGSALDIIYDDPAFSVEGKYANVYYWNKTA